jgi:hypothetical protein
LIIIRGNDIIGYEEIIMDIRSAKRKYASHKGQAKKRNIDWLFTFESWIHMWINSGKWEERGNKGGQYVMSRPGDDGPYSPDNVVIKTSRENVIEAHVNGVTSNPPSMLGKKWSESRRANHDITKINTIERANKISDTLKAKYAAQGGSKTKGRKASPEELARRSNAAKLMWQKRKEQYGYYSKKTYYRFNEIAGLSSG